MVLGFMADGDEGATVSMLGGRTKKTAHKNYVTRVFLEFFADIVAQGDLIFQGWIDGIADPLVEITDHIGHAIFADTGFVFARFRQETRFLVQFWIVEVLVVFPRARVRAVDARQQVVLACVTSASDSLRAVGIGKASGATAGAIPFCQGA